MATEPESTTRMCPSCGAQIGRAQRFCPSCGHRADEPVAAVSTFRSLPQLRFALQQLGEAARTGETSWPLCCCVLGRRRGISDPLRRYIWEEGEYLDELTGSDLLMFVVSHGYEKKVTLQAVNYLGISRASLPCGVFFIPSREYGDDRLVLRLDPYIAAHTTELLDREEDALDRTFHAIAQAAHISAIVPEHGRLQHLRSELERLAPAPSSLDGPSRVVVALRGEPTTDDERFNQLLLTLGTLGSVVGALAAVATLVH